MPAVFERQTVPTAALNFVLSGIEEYRGLLGSLHEGRPSGRLHTIGIQKGRRARYLKALRRPCANECRQAKVMEFAEANVFDLTVYIGRITLSFTSPQRKEARCYAIVITDPYRRASSLMFANKI